MRIEDMIIQLKKNSLDILIFYKKCMGTRKEILHFDLGDSRVKEMIDAIHKSTINSSDSDIDDDDDDFDQAFKPLNNKDLYFNTLDEPTESEKQSLMTKFFV